MIEGHRALLITVRLYKSSSDKIVEANRVAVDLIVKLAIRKGFNTLDLLFITRNILANQFELIGREGLILKETTICK